MRTIVDIPETDLRRLDLIAKRRKVSRAELIRQGVTKIFEEDSDTRTSTTNQFFGFLKDDPTCFHGLDGLAFEQHVRSEWGTTNTMSPHVPALSLGEPDAPPYTPNRPKDQK